MEEQTYISLKQKIEIILSEILSEKYECRVALSFETEQDGEKT